MLPSQLCVGLYVHLDLSWTEHPFTFSSFLIKNLEQISSIQALNLSRIRYTPGKSTAEPLPAPKARAATRAPVADEPPVPTGPSAPMLKQDLVARLNAHVARMRTCEGHLAASAQAVRRITSQAYSQPAEATRAAQQLVERIAGQMPATNEIAVHLMSDKVGGEEVYHHTLNVALLAMVVGRELQLPPADLKALGMGALFHDIGKLALDQTIVRKTGDLTRHEISLLQTHVDQGVAHCAKLGLSPAVTQIVAQHHEHVDGTGYPKHLSGAQISALTKVVSLVNSFDGLCNPANPRKALTPHEALSLLYGQQRARFDAKTLATFVRCMGIYPPGTVVVLSNGALGMVVSVNSSRPLKPTVMVFDPAVRRSEALVIDLEKEPDVAVVKTLRPAQLDSDAKRYLAAPKRTTYYFDTQPGESGS